MKISKIISPLILAVFFSASTMLNAAGISFSTTPQNGSFPLVSDGKAATIVIDENDAEVVKIVSQAFSNDIKLITGVTPQVKIILDSTTPVLVGTLGKSDIIDMLVTNGKIDKARIEGKWETFCISVIDNPIEGVSKALVIAGSDPRGTAFGVFELSRILGVSPWVWWADVTPRKQDALYITGDNVFGPPSVQYRGFFINDEDWAIQPWAARNMDKTIRPNGKGDMGPNTYARIFELMLRMKSNYIWPAMHACTKAFWFYPQNVVMAKRYSIVMGSSHCEQMLRDNEDEWRNNFVTEYGHASGEWNWAINSANITKYWRDRVTQSRNNDAVYTMGMRGIHDSGIPGYNTDEERRTALIDIISKQRQLLTAQLAKPVTDIPQVFIPYKEVLKIYKLGINLPDDVTLMWADDNFGYMRQLSNPAEQSRTGGGGVYYHFSYLGPPQSYLWLESVSPSLATFEMRKAYDLNCRRMWIFNVGDIKPQEFSLQFAMDLAWDINSVDLENPMLYARDWGRENFGEAFADDIYEIKKEYFRLASAGKPEHVSHLTYSVREMEKRIADYEALTEKVRSIEPQIPADLYDAFFQLIKYPVEGAASMNVKHLCAKLSFEYGAQARKQDAIDAGSKSVEAFNHIVDLTKIYNNEIAGAKWNGMMSYNPMNSAYFLDPAVIQEDAISNVKYSALADSVVVIPAASFTNKRSANQTFIQIDGLGVSGKGMTIYPYNMNTYTAGNIATAPYLEYSVPVLKGENKISVQCLPSFPLYDALSLRYAVSIDGSQPEFKDVEAVLEGESASDWGQNVMKGYSEETSVYKSTTDKNVTVRIYFPDPALVVSSIKVTNVQESPLTKLIVNNSFEYAREGQLISSSVNGWYNNAWRPKKSTEGEFYGWKVTNWNFRSSGNYSQGMNQDNMNREGDYACWLAGDLTFSDLFELYQIIPAGTLEPGTYKVQCRLAVEDGKRTSQRLFANQNVQYHGSADKYLNNLTPGEINTFAGHPGATSDLREMSVIVNLAEGESLKIGIRTGRKKGDGTVATNESPSWGWFKVDYFRLEKVEVDTIPVVNDPNDFTDRIVNPGFEYKSQGVLNDGTTFRGTPYGWSDTGDIIGTSFGINNDAMNIVGNNCSWYSSSPMPANFELYQIIRGLPAGTYTLSARMAVLDDRISTQRIFANNNVQYFGKAQNYLQNIVPNETYSFAGWLSTGEGYLKNMSVDVEIREGDSLKIGIRSGNRLSNGQISSSNDGWFKADNFKLKLKTGTNGETALKENRTDDIATIFGSVSGIHINLAGSISKPFEAHVYNFSGIKIYSSVVNGSEHFFRANRGIYFVTLNGQSGRITKKVMVN